MRQITGKDIINMSKQIAKDYEDLVTEQLKTYTDQINELSKEFDKETDKNRKIEICSKMIDLCEEMNETRKELMTNPDYILKYTLGRITGQF